MDTLDPKSGGTVEAGRALTAGLIREGHTVEAVCLDPSGNRWDEGWPCPVHKLGPSFTSYWYCPALLPWLEVNANRFDVFIVHCIYRYISQGVSIVARKRGIPYYVFTHGMLDPWFKQTHAIKHIKKALFWKLIGSRVAATAAAVLYTCEEERRLARLSFSRYECVERIVGLGIPDPYAEHSIDPGSFRRRFPGLKDAPYLLFLGRITRKKGVDLLLEAFAEVYEDDPDTRLVIAGPADTGLQRRLAGLPSAKALGDRLLWTGPLYGDVKWQAISGAEAMTLFSHTENFAICLSEALALRVPVLITNKVNIWREIDRSQAGLVDSNDIEGAKRLLSAWRSTGPDVRERMAVNARRTFSRCFEIGNTVRGLIAAVGETSRHAI